MLPLRIGIDNYCMYPTGMDPLDILRWAKRHGAEGVAFSGLHQEALEALDDVSISAIRSFIAENNMYLEWGGGQHIPVDMTTWQKKDIAKNNLAAARLAKHLGTTIIRSCSGGLMRWDPSSPPTEHFMHEMALFLASQKQMLTDHGVILAIETHFEFTTFELLKVFEMCGASPREYLGICLDTMNLMTMLENPLYGTERILPWVVSTHIKDGGILTTDSGLITFPAAIGTGIIDLEGIIKLLISTGQHIHLSIEDHGGWIDLPVHDPAFLSRFPDLRKEEYESLLRLSELTNARMMNHSLSVTRREDWPELWEQRLENDIVSLKDIVTRITGHE